MAKDKLLGKAVTIVNRKGMEYRGFVAFMDDGIGFTIKIHGRDDFCFDIGEWDSNRKGVIACGGALLYKRNGRYCYDYLKGCIRAGLIFAPFVEWDLRTRSELHNLVGRYPSCPVSNKFKEAG